MTLSQTCYVIGLDAGGTRTRAQVATHDNVLCGEGTGSACNVAALPAADALEGALTAIRAALDAAGVGPSEIRALYAGVAGVSYEPGRQSLRTGLQTHFPAAAVVVAPDYRIALAGATGGSPGVVVIAGTGSIAYGENAAGLSHRAGGYGHLIDDRGSGYGVGRAALAAVLHAADGTGEPTSLTHRVSAALGRPEISEIVPGVYGGGIDRVAIAALSRVVASAAREDGDATARRILQEAGAALANLARGVIRRLFPAEAGAFPLVQIGGLWQSEGELVQAFRQSIEAFAPQASIITPAHPPVVGAVYLALRL